MVTDSPSVCPLLDDEELEELDEAALLLTSHETWVISDRLTSAGVIQKPKHERRTTHVSEGK